MSKKSAMKFITFTTIFILITITFMINAIATSTIGPSLVSMTSNSIIINAIFYKSGATGNKLEIINKATKKEYKFDGIKQSNAANGTYVAKDLDANTDYQIRLTYLSNNKPVYKDISVKTEKASISKKISQKHAYEIMKNNKNYILLDVRPKADYDTQRISGAVSMPYSTMITRVSKELKDKNALIFIYCASGLTSPQAAKLLVSSGYTNVYDIGSISNWAYGTVK